MPPNCERKHSDCKIFCFLPCSSKSFINFKASSTRQWRDQHRLRIVQSLKGSKLSKPPNRPFRGLLGTVFNIC